MTTGELVFAGIVPHPPVMVPEVGGERAQRVAVTQANMMELAQRLKTSQPDLLILMTPHGAVQRQAMGIYASPILQGDLGYFNAPEVQVKCRNDFQMVHTISQLAKAYHIPVLITDRYSQHVLDHGVVAPFYFFHKAGLDDIPLVVLTLSFLPTTAHFQLGQAIAQAILHSGKRVAFIASGDLSHRTDPESPDFTPRGAEFDSRIVNAIQNNDWQAYLSIEPDLQEAAGECGYRTITTLAGLMQVMPRPLDFLSFEAPFGVGYLVAASQPLASVVPHSLARSGALRSTNDEVRMTNREYTQNTRHSSLTNEVNDPMETEESSIQINSLVGLARHTVETYICEGRIVQIARESLPDFQQRRAGIFVSLYTRNKNLRGCIGTIRPTQRNIVEETISNAISAATRDPRFPQVKAGELEDLVYSVSVLNEPEAITDLTGLDPQRYGVIVSSGDRQGLLLPGIESVTTVNQQIQIAMQKAGIMPGEPVWVYRFTVEEHKNDE